MSDISDLDTLLIVEDDENDRLLIEEAIDASGVDVNIQFARNGIELMDNLNNKQQSKEQIRIKLPRLILLDLNMPKMDGRDAIKKINSHPEFKQIPVVVFTTSIAQEDVSQSYELGVNSVIRKPDSYEMLLDFMNVLLNYWFRIVEVID